MAAYAEDAVEYAKGFKKVLDYSEQSIEVIEDICTSLYNDIPKSRFAKLFKKSPDEKTIFQMCKMLGGYIGEVIIRHHGGSWEIENFNHQGEALVLTIGELKTFPVSKVYKRLKNGPEDNVKVYYYFITEELKKS